MKAPARLLGCKQRGAARTQRVGWGSRQQGTRTGASGGKELSYEKGACVSLDIFQEN